MFTVVVRQVSLVLQVMNQIIDLISQGITEVITILWGACGGYPSYSCQDVLPKTTNGNLMVAIKISGSPTPLGFIL